MNEAKEGMNRGLSNTICTLNGERKYFRCICSSSDKVLNYQSINLFNLFNQSIIGVDRTQSRLAILILIMTM